MLRELPPFPLQKVALLDMGQQWRAYSVLSFIAHVGVGSVGSVGRAGKVCREGVFGGGVGMRGVGRECPYVACWSASHVRCSHTR